MKCLNCGTENPEGDKFCGTCGRPLVGATPRFPAVSALSTSTPVPSEHMGLMMTSPSNFAQSPQAQTSRQGGLSGCRLTAIIATGIVVGLAACGVLSCLGFGMVAQLPQSTTGTAPHDLVLDKGWECRHNSIGDMEISGRVENKGDRAVEFVQVRGTLYDANDKALNSDSGYADSDMIPAGGSTTYKLFIPDPDGVGTKCGIRIESARYR